jgi:anaerobic C4-dicarboxylate transporter
MIQGPLADHVARVMGDLSSARLGFVVVLSLFCFGVSFLVRWQAAAPLVTIALAPVATTAGIHPYIVGLIAVVACNGFFLPYQSTPYLALDAGTGRGLFTHAQALPRQSPLPYGPLSLPRSVCLCGALWD